MIAQKSQENLVPARQQVSVMQQVSWLERCERKLRRGALWGLAVSGALMGLANWQLLCSVAEAAEVEAAATKEQEMISLSLDLGTSTISLELESNSATRDLAARTPLKVQLEDFGGGAERIFYLDRELDYSDVKAGSDATVGTVAIYRPWGNVCIFLRAGRPSRDLITLGHVAPHDLEQLKAAPLGEVSIQRH